MYRNDSDLKKNAILESARQIFAEKGFVNTTISEIALTAGIADSAVYKYFNGKEKVLFAIPEQDMELFFHSLGDHLEGIMGAENKLRKLIWYHCKYFTTNIAYTRILLLECRSNPNFYNSEGYGLIRKYSDLIISIIDEGKEQGVIDATASTRLLRDMIMGTMDRVALNWIMQRGPRPLDKAEKIFELIRNAARNFDALENINEPKVKKRKRIIDAATKVFAKKGYATATIAGIAKAAGVAEGTIYEYYKSKEDLMINIPEEKLAELISYFDGVSPDKQLERVILFCFRFFHNNRDFTSILVLMLRANRNFYDSRSQDLLERLGGNIRSLVLDGMEKGLFAVDIDVEIFIDMIFGTIDHIIIPWVIFERKYGLLEIGEQATKLFINAIKS